MEDDKKPKTKASALTPEQQEDLRRRIIEQLDEAADEIDLTTEEEEVLFHLAYKAG